MALEGKSLLGFAWVERIARLQSRAFGVCSALASVGVGERVEPFARAALEMTIRGGMIVFERDDFLNPFLN